MILTNIRENVIFQPGNLITSEESSPLVSIGRPSDPRIDVLIAYSHSFLSFFFNLPSASFPKTFKGKAEWCWHFYAEGKRREIRKAKYFWDISGEGSPLPKRLSRFTRFFAVRDDSRSGHFRRRTRVSYGWRIAIAVSLVLWLILSSRWLNCHIYHSFMTEFPNSLSAPASAALSS